MVTDRQQQQTDNRVTGTPVEASLRDGLIRTVQQNKTSQDEFLSFG